MAHNFPHEVRNRLFLCGSLLLVAAAIPTLAYFGCFKPVEEPQNTWFQRSGSLTVLVAVSIEFLLTKLHKYPGLIGLLGEMKPGPARWHSITYRIIFYSAGFLAAIGTVIWGYGDLLPPETEQIVAQDV